MLTTIQNVAESKLCKRANDAAEVLTTSSFLPRDAMRKRGHCCRPVSVSPSRLCILSTPLKILSNFFVGPVAPSF